MNAHIMTEEQAMILKASQHGVHQIDPVQLTDGSWFILSDVLSESLFEHKDCPECVIVPLEDIIHLLSKGEI